MAEEREAAYGTDGPADEPVFPQAPAAGPGDWNDLGSDPQWPQTGPAADRDDTASMRDPTASFTPGEKAPEVAHWGAPAVASPDDTWRDDTRHDDTWHDEIRPDDRWRGSAWSGPEAAASSNPGRRRRSWGWPAALVAAVLVAGGAGAGVALAVNNNGGSDSPKSVTLPPSSSNTPLSSNAQALNVHSIASHVDPATVDITAKGANGQDEGTGMIITSSGVVLTNNHVIDGSTRVTAQINGNGPTYRTAVLGTDAADDVALLQIESRSTFKTVKLGDSDVITVGDTVVAIGNALGLSGPETVTNGIISATGRSITVGDPNSGLTESLKNMFQSSAAINPGNSGGPLVDASGKVIGMNTAEETGSGSGQSASNVGFAIPINSAVTVAREIQNGKASATVQIGPHPIMGVEVTSVKCAEGGDGCTALGNSTTFGLPFGGTNYTAPVNQGAVVAGVQQGDPAQAAGLSAGDVITSVNGSPINSPTDLTRYMNSQRVGEKATVRWVDPKGQHRSATLNFIQGPNV
jgi:S1-C subfamily serine protease